SWPSSKARREPFSPRSRRSLPNQRVSSRASPKELTPPLSKAFALGHIQAVLGWLRCDKSIGPSLKGRSRSVLRLKQPPQGACKRRCSPHNASPEAPHCSSTDGQR